jgi:hypothetical protein
VAGNAVKSRQNLAGVNIRSLIVQIRVSTRRVFVANARKRTNTPCVSHTMEHFYDSCDRKATVATNTEHQPVSVCGCRIAEHNYEVQEQLKEQSPQRVYGQDRSLR